MERFSGKFNSNTMTKKLVLPIGLTTLHLDIVSEAHIRCANTTRGWEGRVKELGNDMNNKLMALTTGWENLVAENNITDGDTMLFDYHGNSIFTMWVVDNEGNIKQLVDLSRGNIRGIWFRLGNCNLWASVGENSMAAAFYMTKTNTESFMVRVGDGMISAGHVEIPLSFARKFLDYEDKPDTIDVTLHFRDTEVNVTMKFFKKNRDLQKCILNSQITGFVIRNGIKDDGILVFELISPLTPVQFKLIVFQRAN